MYQGGRRAGELVMSQREMKANSAFAQSEWWWSLVKMGGDSAGWSVGRQSACSSVCRTSHRIWVAFLALKSSGVSSSTVSPLPFTPSSRSLLYSLYRENDKRHCREGAHRGQAEAHGTRRTVGDLLRRLKVTTALAAAAGSHRWWNCHKFAEGRGDFGNESW